MAAVGHRLCDQRRLAVVGGVLAVYAAALGTAIVLLALILTFLDAAGITPTTRRLLGRRASQNVVSFGERDMPGALVLVAHYDSGPTRTRPLRPMFLAMVILLACCVARVGGMSGVALTVVQFLATVVLIVYVALMLDIALSPTSQGESDNASGVGVVLRLAERLDRPELLRRPRRLHRRAEGPGSGHARLPPDPPQAVHARRDDRHQHRRRRRRRAPGDEEGGPAPHGRARTLSSPAISTPTRSSTARPSDGYAAASAGLPSVTFAGTTDRLEEDNLAEAEEACVRLIEEIDEELG